MSYVDINLNSIHSRQNSDIRHLSRLQSLHLSYYALSGIAADATTPPSRTCCLKFKQN